MSNVFSVSPQGAGRRIDPLRFYFSVLGPLLGVVPQVYAHGSLALFFAIPYAYFIGFVPALLAAVICFRISQAIAQHSTRAAHSLIGACCIGAISGAMAVVLLRAVLSIFWLLYANPAPFASRLRWVTAYNPLLLSGVFAGGVCAVLGELHQRSILARHVAPAPRSSACPP